MQSVHGVVQRGLAIGLLLLLAACGGGGGGGSTATDEGVDGGGAGQGALPTLSQDTVPSGQRIDVAALDLFPVHAGDEWVYQVTGGNIGEVTRAVISGPDVEGRFVVSETIDGIAEPADFRVTAEGITAADPVGAQGLWPAVYAALPSVLEYATPLYPVGGERKIVRQGDMGVDLDGDRRTDFYRVEISQIFRGFKNIAVLGADTEVAHFTNRLAFMVSSTSDGSRYTVNAVEEAYFAPGLGLVRSKRSAQASDGEVVVEPYTLDLFGATIDGVRRGANASRAILLEHTSLIFDARRSVYYASTPGTATPGNRIAVIDAEDGAVRYSRAIGSSPGPMAIASDGASMYVGLAGSGEVVRLALPALTEMGRVRLPVDDFFGQMHAEAITASPVAPGVFAVSLIRPGVTPRHGGVALVRDLVVQPVRTQDHTGSNRVAFGADGRWLYGYNTETTESGLRRIEVLADGLAERTVVPIDPGLTWAFEVVDDTIIVGPQVYRADSSLARLGTFEKGGHCFPLRGTGKLACRGMFEALSLDVVDAASFEILGSIVYLGTDPYSAFGIVSGPPGRLAVSDQKQVQLLASPLLK